jgi:glucose-1-phosphate cytidylyltransferase
MKAVILAGGLGTRISEETQSKPKPMVEIGGQPILWHIMKSYSGHGITDFIICCGYKGYVIKEYFSNYFTHMSDITIDIQNNSVTIHREHTEPWKITLVDTGENTNTGGRLLRVRDYLPDNEPFCFTYGDGLSDINISASIEFHKSHGLLATITAAFPPGRFGSMQISNKLVTEFKEKPKGDGARVNAGFFVLEKSVLDLIEDDSSVWEELPLASLVLQRQLMSFVHDGFWMPMDTLRDKNKLEDLWISGDAPWKVCWK